MLAKPFVTIILTTRLLIPVSGLGAQAQTPRPQDANGPIICTVMESFEEGKLGVLAIVFHQRDKADGPRLGSFLLAHSGEEVDWETARGQHYRATVFRVRSCFGRGLVLVPTNKLKLREHDEFTLRLAE